MSVRAKFKVISVTDCGDGKKSIALSAVTSGSPENEQFFQWTPSAAINMATINAEAAKQFEVGAEFYVDFTLA